MRHFFIFLLVAASALPSFAQADHGYNLYGQLLGNSSGIGIGFDTRFKPGGVLGYSAGLAFTDITWNDGILGAPLDGNNSTFEVHSTGVTIPLAINAIMGNRASKFEVELGATGYLVNRNEHRYLMGWSPDVEDFCSHRKVFRPNVAFTLGFGYRLQHTDGFFMKLGLNLLLGDLHCSPIDSYVLLPNICLGYTIPHF